MSKRTVCECGAALRGHDACWNCNVPIEGAASETTSDATAAASAATRTKRSAKKSTAKKRRTAKK